VWYTRDDDVDDDDDDDVVVVVVVAAAAAADDDDDVEQRRGENGRYKLSLPRRTTQQSTQQAGPSLSRRGLNDTSSLKQQQRVAAYLACSLSNQQVSWNFSR